MQRSWLQVAGLERSAADVRLPSLLCAVAVPAPIACGDVLAVDVQSAEQQPGVVCVLTANSHLDESARRFEPLLQTLLAPTVQHAGQIVAVVVAETQQKAVAAAAKVDLRVRAKSACLSIAAALAAGAVGSVARRSIEHPAESFAQAKTRFVQTYRTSPRHAGSYPDGVATAVWRDDGLTLFTVGRPAPGLAERLGLRPEQLLAVSSFVGSERVVQGPQVELAVIAAAQLRRPVRMIAAPLDATGIVPETIQTVQIGLADDGRPSALLLRGAVGTARPVDASVVDDASMLAKLYGFAAQELHVVSTAVHFPSGDGQSGSIGSAQGLSLTFGLESAIDELAAGLGADPIAIRLRWLDGNESNEANMLRGCLSSLQRMRAQLVDKYAGDWRLGVSSAIHRGPAGRSLVAAHLVLASLAADRAPKLCHLFSLADGSFDAAAEPLAILRRSLDRARRLAMRPEILTLPRAGWASLHADDSGAEPTVLSCVVSGVQVDGEKQPPLDADSLAQVAEKGVDAAMLSALAAAMSGTMSERARQLPVAWRSGRVAPS